MSRRVLQEDATLNVLREHIMQCRSDIIAYDTQFISSAAVPALMAAAAAIFTTNAGHDVWKLFYVLPSLSLIHVYNLLKYTNKIWELGAYRMVMEHMVNQKLHANILCWGTKVEEGGEDPIFKIFGAFIQPVFGVPVAFFMLWGFFHLSKDLLWWIVAVFLLIQSAVLLVMTYQAATTRARTLKKLGYKFVDGELIEIGDG